MRSHILPAFILMLSVLSSCKKSDDTVSNPTPTPTPTNEQRVVLLVFNGSWDGLSGSEFKPFLAKMKKDYPSIPVVSMHISGTGNTDPLENQAVKDVNAWLPAEFHPDSSHAIPYCYFGANSTLKGIKKTDFTTMWSNMVQYIADSKAVEATATVDFSTLIRNDSVIVSTTTTFHKVIAYGYSMAVFLVEDDVAGTQVNDASTNTGEHDNVLRAMPTDPYGDFFYKNAVAGQKVNGQYKIKLDPTWNRSKLSVVTALWYNMGAAGTVLCNGTVKAVNP